MTRDEFESILEEVFEEGYNQAIFDIQEDILDEEAFDLEGEYDYYSESSKNVRKQMDKLNSKTDTRTNKYTDREYVDSKTYRPGNPKHDWAKYVNNGTTPNKNKSNIVNPNKYSSSGDTFFSRYTVYNTDTYPDRPKRVIRGRIKAANYDASDDPRSFKLRDRVRSQSQRNAYKEKIAKRPFKNKPGNKYDDN